MPKRPLIPRDKNIDSTVSYSDLFFDSSRLEDFLAKQQMSDTLRETFRSWYNTRNYQYAWFAHDGFTEQALAFYSLYTYSKDSSRGRKWLDERLDSLLSQDSLRLSGNDPRLIRTELLMTWRLMNYLADRYPDEDQRSAALFGLVPVRKRDPLAIADTMLATDNTGSSPWDQGLVSYLKKYVAMQRAGQADTIARATRKKPARTVPAMSRIKQILVNLLRTQWMPPDVQGRLILVNIPEYKLHVLEGQQKVFDMNIVVGKEGHSTVLFSGLLDRIVFNPYWNVPKSIVKKEVLPGIGRDSGYLEKHQMEISGKSDGLPIVRQVPGPTNELGRMKFLFPNSFNIYLHDTPHKELFSQKQRAYSHGCIRVADAPKLADYLLDGQAGWNAGEMDSILATNTERMVKVQQPAAVLICYLTCWGDSTLEFRKDIYGHDRRVARMLFLPEER